MGAKSCYLDDNNIVWKYEYMNVVQDKNNHYRGDFFIFENNLLTKIIEVKGYMDEKSKNKLIFAKNNIDVPIEIWDNSKMKELNLI